MARLGRLGFLAMVVIFHLIYAWSIFDIYFVSPIVRGMREFRVESVEPPAKRLVLFVGDGLRADKAFQSFPDPSPSNTTSAKDALKPRPLMPFLRSKVMNEGTFGVSHTRVPTESRPGHVALIAGLYEDVSAVMTGWKLNPVNFDSVFNKSRHTWSWGSPDILPMFKEGSVPGRIDAYTYGAEAEDFTADAVELDIWVFERVKKFFKEAKTNATLDAALRQDKVVFFLHLLGLDTTGHAYRPYSKEYLHNIKVVDQGVQEITELIEEFYGDSKTAYVFTADHGMSDWGSHGDGHPDNTRTPLIAWGSGVAKPVVKKKGIAAGHEDGFSSDWGMDRVQRNDVAQADIAALMAYLAGLAFPVNSVGELPLQYLDASPKAKAEALLVNTREILEMYHVKEAQKKAKELRYVPFPGFRNDHSAPAYRIANIEKTIKKGHPDEAIRMCTELMKDTLEGLRYLQTYDWLFLRILVTIGYLGWVAYALTTVVDLHVLHGQTDAQRSHGSNVFFSSVLIALFALLIVHRAPYSYYLYALFPLFFWEEVWARRSAILKGKDALFGHLTSKRDIFGIALQLLAFVGVLEALVQSYFHREVYTVCYLLAIAWPASYGMTFLKQNKALVSTWGLACALMSLFTLLPANKVENLTLVLLGGILMVGVGLLYLLYEESVLEQQKHAFKVQEKHISWPISRTVIGTQIGLILLALITTRSSILSLQARQGLPLGTQITGWLVLFASLTVPFLHSLEPNNHYLHRLLVVFLTFSPIFIILTISYEGLFYFALCITLLTWVRLEHQIHHHSIATKPPPPTANGIPSSPIPSNHAQQNGSSDPKYSPTILSRESKPYRALTLSDLRISLFALFLLHSAFFSTGNIASVSSFSLDAVYRLIPVFDPFSQSALLLFKILVPFAVLSAHVGLVNRMVGLAPGAVFLGVVAVGDYGTMRFFWCVRDEGSWLEIGTSISQFVISGALGMFVAGLEGVGEVMMMGVDGGYGEAGEVKGGMDGHGSGNGVVT